MGNQYFQFLFILFMGFLFIVTNEYNWVVAAAKFQCVDSEQKALLMFKQGFQSPSGHFTSWVAEEDCCKWKGIECNNITGHVTTLDLHSPNSVELLQGRIPRCINNFLVMARREADCTYCYYVHASYAKEKVKTRMWLVSDTYGYEYPMVMDFSSNKLTGGIPREITELIGLADLNLSNNHLTGTIPCNIGAMKTLYSLDLSRNQLSHNIPPSISDLIDLESLDFSYNNLSGKVPSFNSSSRFEHGANSYVGNPRLCGPPLPNDCSKNESIDDTECSSNKKSESQNHGIQKEEEHKDDGFVEMHSFYVSIAIGFVTGFLGFWTFLALIESWRHAYFHFLGNMGDKIYVFVVVTMARLQRKFQREQAAE